MVPAAPGSAVLVMLSSRRRGRRTLERGRWEVDSPPLSCRRWARGRSKPPSLSCSRIRTRRWPRYPGYPPSREPGSDPPPHATLGRLVGPTPTSLDAARKRLEGLLPARCDVREVALMEEHDLDRMRIRETFPFGG